MKFTAACITAALTAVSFLPDAAHATIKRATVAGSAQRQRIARHGKGKGKGESYFNRISSFFVCSQIDADCNDDTETAAEIVTVSEDGMTAIYSDSPLGVVGFVDISDPYAPQPLGTLDVGGEPTSVAVCGTHAIVCVNTSPDFLNPSGQYVVVDIATQTIVATGDLGGQPDSIDVSPDCTKAVVAIENERDEDLGDGGLPQLPAGFVAIIDISNMDPNNWSVTPLSLVGLAGIEMTDPEPEYVSINEDNIAVVTLQENNSIVLIDLNVPKVLTSFSAGTVDLKGIDTEEEGIIDPSSSLAAVPREPDGVAWIGTKYFATANEGDWNGGSRGFSIFDTDGKVVYDSENLLDLLAIQVGQYPDERSGNKGNEPENLVYAEYGGEKLLFVNSERSSIVFVFDVSKVQKPKLKQILPAGSGPEGSKAIPSRNLLLVASEVDSRGDAIRSVINIYLKDFEDEVYPYIVSDEGMDGTPIPFSALSALATAKCDLDYKRRGRHLLSKRFQRGLSGKGKGKGNRSCDKRTFYSVDDSFYNKNRILAIDTDESPAVVYDEMTIMDADGVFAASLVGAGYSAQVADLINDDKTINIDPEGLDTSYMGGFWLAHEGSGTTGDASRPFESPNILFKLDEDAIIEQVILPPAGIIADQVRFGYEGVAEAWDMGIVVVTFQRELQSDPSGLVRLGVWDLDLEEWTYYFYPLDTSESQNGGWVGLSDITYAGDGEFYILERDNQGGPDAAIKRIYSVTLDGPGEPFGTTPPTVTKLLKYNLMKDLEAATNGPIVEKVEGITIDYNGNIWINNDNDGVDDNSGEQILLNLKNADCK